MRRIREWGKRGKHIIRGKNELSRIRDYIRNNPLQWEMDAENR